MIAGFELKLKLKKKMNFCIMFQNRSSTERGNNILTSLSSVYRQTPIGASEIEILLTVAFEHRLN